MMKKIISFITFVSVFFGATAVIAQNASWNYNINTGSIGTTYNWIDCSGGTSIVSGDDTRASFNWPFTFSFYDDTYTTSDNISVCTNGFIRFDGDAITNWNTASNYDLSLGDNDLGQIIAMGVYDGSVGDNGGYVNYLVTGTAPNRVLTIEFNNIEIDYNDNNFADIQVSLYETSNKIVLKFGTEDINKLGVDMGICSGDANFYNFWDEVIGSTSNSWIEYTPAGLPTQAGDFRSRRDGNWNRTDMWQKYDGTSWNNTTEYPGQNPGTGRVTIRNGHQLDLNLSVANSIGSIYMQYGNDRSDIDFNDGSVLNVTGEVVIAGSSTDNRFKAIRVNNGTLSAASITIDSEDDNQRDAFIQIDNGTVSVIGDVVLNNTNRRTYVSFIGGGTLNVGGDMSGGGITSNNNGATVASGTVNYNGTGAQSVADYTYYNLTFSGGGAKTVAGAITVDGVFISSEQIDATANITVNGSFNLSNQINTSANISLNGAVLCSGGTINATSGVVTYNAAAANVISGTYNNLTKTGGGTSTLCGDVLVTNILNLNTGIIRLSNSDLTVSNTVMGAITGTFSAANMIETDGDGMLTKYGTDAGLSIVYPIGSGGYYTPMDLSNGIIANYSGTGSISVRAVSGSQGTGMLAKYWEVSTSNITSITDVYPLFTYDLAEADASQASYLPWYNSGSVWQAPSNPTGAGVNPFGSTSINELDGEWTSGVSAPIIPNTYYSYQTGDWDQASTWTHDPGGTTQNATDFPNTNDRVVILDGRTVTLTSDLDTAGLDINIKEGATLDLSTYQFNNGIATLRGQGTFKLASVNYPTVTSNLFVLAGGGTTEYYNAANFTLPVAQTEYNNLRINTPVGVVATQLSNITLNGDLHVERGTYQINDNSVNRRQLTIQGDVLVNNVAFITTGTGNTLSGDISGATTAAPFIDYYDLNSHRVVVYGDFTNNGTVKFTNQSYPEYDAFPTNGMATVYFMGATNNTLRCNGTTDFYNLVLDKGIDQTYKLTVYSSAYSNFRLFGRNDLGGENGGDNPDLRKALWIRTGTLELTGLSVIPSLTEADIGGSPNGDFYIPVNAALLLNGTEVVVLSTADDYREVNLAYGVSALSNGDMGVRASGGTQSFSIYGKFQIDNGYFSTRESGGIITWDVSSGELLINGGIVDAKQYRSAGGGGGLASFNQSGGTFILRGRFQRTPAAYSSINNLKDFSTTTLNTTRNTGGLDGTLGTFNINNTENVFSMSGGTIRIYDVCGTTQNEAFEVYSDDANNSVTGGTLELIPTTGSGGDATEFIIKTTADLGNLTINRASSSATVDINTYDITILEDLTITSGELDANSLDISIGGDFIVESGTVYTPGTNWTIFNGSGVQSFEINTASALSVNKFKVDKPASTVLTMTGTQNTLNVADSMMIITGTLADGGKTINLDGTIATSSYLYNSGLHTGSGKIVMNDNVPQVITGDGNGIFENLELNNTDASTAPVSLEANTTINGILTLSQDNLFDISTYNLTFGEDAMVVNAGTNRFIQSAGNAGDGGITKTYSALQDNFTFPIGAPTLTPVQAVKYTPAAIEINGSATTYGTITVVPVGYEHPNTTNKNRSLTYFWRTKSEGFTLGAATINHSYTYVDADLVTGGDITEAGYVAAMYDNDSYTWTKYAATDVNDATNTIGGAATALASVNFIDGEFTAGDDDALDPFGTPVVYYSRQTGQWDDGNTWSLTGHTGSAAGSWPGASDIVIIGGQDSVYLATNPTTPNTGDQNAATLKIEQGSALDIGYNPDCNFAVVLNHSNGNGNFRLTCDRGPLFWTTVRTFEFPTGDFSDFNTNLGTTELYTTNDVAGTTFYLPNGIDKYGNLIISPLGGSNIIFPNNDLLIYGNLEMRGTDPRSWFLPTWNTNYPTAPTTRIAKTITIQGNVDLIGGSFVWYGGGGGGSQDVIIHGDITVFALGGIEVAASNTSQSLAIGGSLINNTTGINWGTAGNPSISHCDFTDIPLIFFGDNTAYITNTSGAPITIFEDVTIDKGTSQADSLVVDIGGTLTTPADDWLTLLNGTFSYEHNDDLNITQGSQFTIPATAGLYINSPGNTVYLANALSNDNDVYLNGKLTVIDGDVVIGNSANDRNNDIEYSGGGNSEINIQGGSLFVNGQIRRNPSTSAGILKYSQSGGAVIVNGRNAITEKAKLEILNAGSEFNMSGGTLTIVRGGGGGTFGDLYLRPGSSTVTGGEIIFNPGATAQSFIFDANVPVWDLTISANADVELLVSSLTVQNDLTIASGGTLDANINFDIPVTINGDFDNSGVYEHRNNLTTFNGSTQQILGSAAIDFYDLTVNSLTRLTLDRDANVDNDLILSRGTLECDVNTVYVQGDVTNNATYTDTNSGIVLNGTTEQLIDGTGTWGQLELDNSQGARVENDLTLQDDLILTSGVFDINDELLTLGAASDILGAPFDETKMITSDGVFSDVGLRKYFSIYSGADQTFTFPIGTSGKYTPAELTYSDIGNVGYIRINNINDNHPGVLDNNNVLDYYWEVESDGITGFNGSLVLNYLDEDVLVTGSNTEADYIAAALLIPGTSWIKSIDDVDETANTITFNYAAVSSLNGEYTAGVDAALPNEVPEFTSINDGDWNDPSNWLQTAGDAYALSGGPNGFIVIVDSDDTITANINNATAYRIAINGKLKVVSPTYGHNLGTVSGSGILYLESGTFPAGRYTDFLDCANNATLEYSGTTNYSIVADLYSSIPNLHFTGTGTRTLPNKDLTICNQLLIDGPT